MRLPLGRSAYRRSASKEPEIRLVNRYFEENPTNLEEGTALLARPGNSQLASLGAGPIRAVFSEEDLFGSAAFIVSGDALYRYNKDGTSKVLPATLNEGDTDPEMAATRTDLWITDQDKLWYYNGVGSFAFTKFTLGSDNAGNNETITLGSRTYTFKTTLTGALDEVLIGATETNTLLALEAAINAGPGGGTLYGSGTVANSDVTAQVTNDDVIRITAKVAGVSGNSVAATISVIHGSLSSTPTLAGGAVDALNEVPMPDVQVVRTLAVLGEFVLLGIANSDRVYFIRPGSHIVVATDFFTAEQIPDRLVAIRTFGDQAWLVGARSTEAWYLSGGAPLPFSRVRGQAFSRGGIAGTPHRLGNAVLLVGDDGIVYRITGGIQRISTHGVEEQVRLARKTKRLNP